MLISLSVSIISTLIKAFYSDNYLYHVVHITYMQPQNNIYTGIIISLREMGYTTGYIIPLTALHQISWNMPLKAVKMRKAFQICMCLDGTLEDFGDGFFMLNGDSQ